MAGDPRKTEAPVDLVIKTCRGGMSAEDTRNHVVGFCNEIKRGMKLYGGGNASHYGTDAFHCEGQSRACFEARETKARAADTNTFSDYSQRDGVGGGALALALLPQELLEPTPHQRVGVDHRFSGGTDALQ